MVAILGNIEIRSSGHEMTYLVLSEETRLMAIQLYNYRRSVFKM